MGLVAYFDQLAGNTQALAIAADASLQHTIDVHLSCDFSNGFLRAFVLDCRSSRDYAQSLGIQPAEVRDHLVRQAVGKVFLIDFTTHVFEGEHEKHSLTGRRLPGLDQLSNEAIAKTGKRFDISGASRAISQ